jgi:ABC-2 type transport system ATP-binding protein
VADLAQVVGVSRRFGSFLAVDDVSLSVGPGEVVGLLGANGAGKTTVIRMLMGLAEPTSGEVRLFGQAPSRDARRHVGYVPQGLGLYDDLTVAENLAFVSAAYGCDVPPVPEGLDPDALVGGIGLGRQRRLAFTAALSHGPQLLVLDEPTSGVDPLARARLWDTVHTQAEAGVGVLVTTHYMSEAQQCDRLVMMSRGRCVATGTEADLTGTTSAVEVRTPGWSDAFAALDEAGFLVTLAGRAVRVADVPRADVEAALRAAGVPAEVEDVRATLEEAMTVVDRADRSSGPG